jgi:ribosome biogenesis protein ERB1
MARQKGNEIDDKVPPVAPLDYSEDEEEESVYDSEDGLVEEDSNSEGSDEEDFEDQGSSDDDEGLLEKQQDDDNDSDDGIAVKYEKQPRSWNAGSKRESAGGDKKTAEWMHADDWSSDEDDTKGIGNRIGRVPIHWYDGYEHIGYDAHGKKIVKSASASGDLLDKALAHQDNMAKGKFVVHDALNDRDIELSARQLELIRRVQAGAYAHPEHEAYPDYIDYFSGVDKEISGLNADRTLPKSRFQPNPYEKMQVDKLLEKLEKGTINMDYLTGKIRDMKDVRRKDDQNKLFAMWTGDDEDLLSMRKGPQHIAAPKMPPPGHAASYIPPDEYLPTEEELDKWKEMEPADRPHGHFIPKKFPNLRSVGAYQHSVREAFERCLDLYLCPRVMKRRLNIDPESLVPRLPRASDLKPFPTAKCIEYVTPYDGDEAPAIRSITASPDGQFMASGGTDGVVRIWEVQTGRLLRSWDISTMVAKFDADTTDEGKKAKVVVCVEWNPNRLHHCLLASVGSFVVVIATGTAGQKDAELTDALLSSASNGGSVVSGTKASNAVAWNAVPPNPKDISIASSKGLVGPICVLRTSREVACIRWQAKGDYFVSVSPKAGASAVLIHQLSKGNSQQPFNKAKGEALLACFHPNKPFLFVASQQHVRVYHLVKQGMVKRLISGCRWISSMDIHPSGDHLIVGSLDRRVIWFDLDLSTTPYRTLKYHERAIRACRFHGRYPLMASASDDGAVHVFHSMVYSDLMRNPLVVPVKILRGHTVTKKYGVLSVIFHPTQPWLFTGGSDGKLFLWQDI